MSLVVGWTHLRVDFLIKFCTMFISIAIIVVAFSQAPIVQLYHMIDVIE